MATKYELPEEANIEFLKTLGKEVEMKTFKTNTHLGLDKNDAEELLKIICVGEYTGGFRTKGTFINDYLQRKPSGESSPPLVGVGFALKTFERWQRSIEFDPITIRLHLWEIPEKEYFSPMTRLYFKCSDGALVFWGPGNPSSLGAVPKWLTSIKEVCSSIPCVLITDNIGQEPRQWVGPGKIFDSELELDQFCEDHGFVGHFEITSRDWESGDKSVFGQAVNCLVDAIIKI